MIWIPNKLLKQFIYKKRGEMQCHQLMAVFHLAQSIFNYNLEWSFGIINEKGEVENKNSFWKDSVNFHAFDHICCMSYTYRPAIIKDSILYFSQSLLKYPRKKDEWDKIPIFAYADLHKKTRVDRTTIPIYF